jgi:hypothetical protein
MVKSFLLAALATGSFQVMASEGYTGSQYLYQAPMDQIVVTPTINYTSEDADRKGSITSSKKKGYEEKVRGEYGINEMLSAGLQLAYANWKTEYSPSSNADDTYKGLEDLKFFILGRTELGFGSLRYGSDVNFALEKDIIDTNGHSRNNGTGGISVEPFVGFERISGACTYGAKLSYLTLIGDRKAQNKSQTPTLSSDISGGEKVTLGLFYEHKMEPVVLGASLEWASLANEKSKYSGNTIETAGHSFARLNVYVPYDVTSSVTLLPKVSYAQWTAMDTENFDGVKTYNLEVAARFTF